jgi:formimidoylglutamate deiminase
VGQQADFVVLDARHVALNGLPADSGHAAHVFASHRTSAIADVWVRGQQRAGRPPCAARGRATGLCPGRKALLQNA